MIKTLKKGIYQLLETKNQTKILILDDKQIYAWIYALDIGEILVNSSKKHIKDVVLALGKYCLFDVKDENKLTDMQHLELEVGKNKWQGYLLLTGLPTGKDKRNRIIPTDQLINQK